MTTYTPGRWIKKSGMVCTSKCAVAIYGGGGGIVKFPDSLGEQEKNGHLIAAAPDMLLSLLTLRDMLQDSPQPSVLNVINFAIDRAHGKSAMQDTIKMEDTA